MGTGEQYYSGLTNTITLNRNFAADLNLYEKRVRGPDGHFQRVKKSHASVLLEGLGHNFK
jgi:hypothetical protein